jgi:hypothetical protein
VAEAPTAAEARPGGKAVVRSVAPAEEAERALGVSLAEGREPGECRSPCNRCQFRKRHTRYRRRRRHRFRLGSSQTRRTDPCTQQAAMGEEGAAVAGRREGVVDSAAPEATAASTVRVEERAAS